MAQTVLVTGASGFVASEVIKQLLEKGYSVKGTVRSLNKALHLQKLADALPGTLELLEADLLKEGDFDAAVAGCSYVFHVASPFLIDVPDAQSDLLDPALKGTINVLTSVSKHKETVKRVILTSSVAAVHGGASKAPPRNGALYTEDDWNETSTLDNKEAYWVSKVIAEREAWKLAELYGLDLVTIAPNFILGPLLSTRIDGLSAGFIKGWLEGKGGSGNLVISDVRDVAKAHISAAETPEASGRYIISQTSEISPKLVSDVLKANFPGRNIPDGEDNPVAPKVDTSKAAKDLGFQATAASITLVDMARTAIQLGIVD